MSFLLMYISFCFLSPCPSVTANTNTISQHEITIRAASNSQEDKKEDNRTDNDLEGILFGSGVGLVTVGGVGAGVIAHNNKKPKDVPTKTVENPYDGEAKEKKESEE